MIARNATTTTTTAAVVAVAAATAMLCAVRKTLMSSALRNYHLITFSQYQHSLTVAATTTTTTAAAGIRRTNATCSSGVKRHRPSDEAYTASTERCQSEVESTAKKCRQQSSPSQSVTTFCILIILQGLDIHQFIS